ncbi:MAG: hypothetical protein U0637_11720 [Phycisphaerales bacterium]
MRRTTCLACLASTLAATAALAQPLSTAFSYQGQLQNGGTPASGLYDFRFRLFDASSGGVQVGPTLCADNVTVSDGVFSTSLDFGAAFAGARRFLEVQVRTDTGLACATTTGFTALAPLQEVTAAPQAQFALSASTTAQLNGQPATFYTSAANLSTGTLPDSRLSANVPRLGSSNAFLADATFNTQVGIGGANGSTVPLWVQRADSGTNTPSTSTVLALENNGAAYAQFFSPLANESGILFGHASPDPSIAGAIIFNNPANTEGLLFRTGGNTNRMCITSTGDVGIGTTSPLARLHVAASSGPGEVTITPSAANGNSQVYLAENNSATGGIIARCNGAANQFEVLGFSSAAEQGPHLTIARDSGNTTINANLTVHGNLTIDAATRYLSIPASAFTQTTNMYINGTIMHNNALISGTLGEAVAPVSLPQGAVVTGFQLVASDTANTNATANFIRTAMDSFLIGGTTTVSSVSTSGTSGYQRPQDTSISSATIDNSQNLYWVGVFWNKENSGNLDVAGIRITYTVTTPLP